MAFVDGFAFEIDKKKEIIISTKPSAKIIWCAVAQIKLHCGPPLNRRPKRNQLQHYCNTIRIVFKTQDVVQSSVRNAIRRSMDMSCIQHKMHRFLNDYL